MNEREQYETAHKDTNKGTSKVKFNQGGYEGAREAEIDRNTAKDNDSKRRNETATADSLWWKD